MNILAEVPGASLANLQPAEHLLFCKQFSKTCPSAFRDSEPLRSEGAGVKTAPKSSLDRCGCSCKISRSLQGFGFPKALHIPTDKETYVCLPILICIDRLGVTSMRQI